MSQGEVYISDADGIKINPAILEEQVLLRNMAAQSVSTNSLNSGTEKVTLGGAAVRAGDQPCRMVFVSHANSNATYVESNGTGDADASSFLIPANVIMELPVRNTNKLSFFGTTADAVHILWRD